MLASRREWSTLRGVSIASFEGITLMRDDTHVGLLQAIQRVHREYIDDAKPSVVFDNLLSCLLEFTISEYGFIGEVRKTDSGQPYLKTHAISNVAWNEETRLFYDEQAPQGMEFHNMNTLFGAVITSGEALIANRPQEHPRRGGTPEGHPKLEAFLGLPLFQREELIGLIGLANRAGGYDQELIDSLEPLLTTCVSLVRAHASARRRRSAEAALRDSEQRYRRLVEDQPELLSRFLIDGTLTFVNRAYADYFDRTIGECEHLNLFDLIPESDHAAVREHFGQLGPEKPTARNVHRVTAANGELRWMQWTNRALFDDDGNVVEFQSLGIDITERMDAEEERKRFDENLAQVQKLESLGVLAGGIAHDFNNLLTSILGNADLALARLRPDSTVHGNLKEIEVASQRAAELCQQMLAYSGRGRFQTEVVDLAELVEEMLQILELSVSKKAAIRLYLDDRPNCRLDVTQIRQVLMNLITNASDALGDQNGVIRIRTGMMDCGHDYLQSTYVDDDLPQGAYAFVEVSDSGCGMDGDARARLFDPFFTTKLAGRGLGMAAVLGIVRGHRGAIRIVSDVDVGTTIRVLLPASAEVPDAGLAADADAVVAMGGTATVLVVDDERCVRDLARASLTQSGYEVLSAVDGEDALSVFRESMPLVDVVVLDLTMPRLGGHEVLPRLRAMRPDMPIVLCSGYDTHDIEERFINVDRLAFLHKPYRPAKLVAAIEHVLRTNGRSSTRSDT